MDVKFHELTCLATILMNVAQLSSVMSWTTGTCQKLDVITRRVLKSETGVKADIVNIFQYVTVRIHPDQMMSHGGTTDPCANSELQSIGHMGNEENIQMSKDISEFLQQKLGIDPKRNYIKFTNLKPLDVWFEGTTIEDLRK
ncbi:macrophage migration inhibitory factor-like [Haliotis rufescens]|uniref:macrophage migration inhibitory factor-like n=1 Tax=Haliotis rufescens TaxID=6454 RepID=UPI00201E94B5|nr:macrophage migration inhibitory factor-like [Haliotis rufescens]